MPAMKVRWSICMIDPGIASDCHCFREKGNAEWFLQVVLNLLREVVMSVGLSVLGGVGEMLACV